MRKQSVSVFYLIKLLKDDIPLVVFRLTHDLYTPLAKQGKSIQLDERIFLNN